MDEKIHRKKTDFHMKYTEREKRALYESIMRDVAKTVTKHLNEDAKPSTKENWILRIRWAIDKSEFLRNMITEVHLTDKNVISEVTIEQKDSSARPIVHIFVNPEIVNKSAHFIRKKKPNADIYECFGIMIFDIWTNLIEYIHKLSEHFFGEFNDFIDIKTNTSKIGKLVSYNADIKNLYEQFIILTDKNTEGDYKDKFANAIANYKSSRIVNLMDASGSISRKEFLYIKPLIALEQRNGTKKINLCYFAERITNNVYEWDNTDSTSEIMNTITNYDYRKHINIGSGTDISNCLKQSFEKYGSDTTYVVITDGDDYEELPYSIKNANIIFVLLSTQRLNDFNRKRLIKQGISEDNIILCNVE